MGRVATNEELDKNDVSEVEDNLKYMSKRQRSRAKMARKAFQALGAPTLDDFKAILRMNLIRNAKNTTTDIN